MLLALIWAFAGLVFWKEGNVWVYSLSAIVLLPITWLLLRSWVVRGRPGNWVLAATVSGIWVNLRDNEYLAVEQGNTVVFLPYSEVQLARHVIHRYKTRDTEGDVSHKDVYLDLQIASPDFEQLRAELQADRQRRSPGKKRFGGIETMPGKIRQQPVQVIDDDVLRIKFTAGNFGLLPRPKKVLAVLSKYIAVEKAAEISTAETKQQSDGEFDEMVIKMVTEGRDVQAIELVRDRTGKSQTEARVFVDELRSQLP